MLSRVPCLCCLFWPQAFGVSRHLSHLDHGAPSPCLAKTFGAPTLGAGYLLVNNPVFQLEPYGLSVLCCVLCAVGCGDNTLTNKRSNKQTNKQTNELGALLYLRFFKLRVFCFLGTSFFLHPQPSMGRAESVLLVLGFCCGLSVPVFERTSARASSPCCHC